MQLTYNGVALHSIGVLQVGGETSEFIPADLPQRRRVRLNVTLDTFAQTWAANRTALEAVRTALALPQATLLWYDDSASKTVLNQTATVLSHDFPTDPNSWGTYRAQLNLVFVYEDAAFTPSLFTLTYTPNTGSAVTLTSVFGHKRRGSVERYSPLRDLRSRAAGRVDFRGQIVLNPASDLPTRRAAAVAVVSGLVAAFNTKNGTLLYQTSGGAQVAFNKVVRVSEFEADVNQAADGAVDWSLSAEYTEFPNESSYGAADFTVRTAVSTLGDSTLTISGRIGAESAATANSKLAGLRATYASGLMRVNTESDQHRFEVDDGGTFIELNFSESYRVDPTEVGSEFTIRDVIATSGEKTRTLSGRIVAVDRATADAKLAALRTAYASGLIRLTTESDEGHLDVAAEDAFTGLSFNETYFQPPQSGVELTIRNGTAQSGEKTRTLSGRIVALDLAAANIKLATLRSTYASGLMKLTSDSDEQRIEVAADGIFKGLSFNETYRDTPQPGSEIAVKNFTNTFGEKTRTLSGRITAVDLAAANTKLAALRSTYASGLMRLNGDSDQQQIDVNDVGAFMGLSFNETYRVYRAGGGAAEVAVKFSYTKEVNWRTRATTSSISGTVQADTASNALSALEAIVATYSLGALVTSRDTESRERNVSANLPTDATGFIELAFDRTYDGTQSGDDMVLECDLSEEVTFSGTRWVVRPTAYGRDKMQACGIQSGTRTISGRVFATTEALAYTFARNQAALPWGPVGAGSPYPTAPSVHYVQPPTFTAHPRFLPGVSGAIRGGGANAQGWEVSFRFAEILPDYDRV